MQLSNPKPTEPSEFPVRVSPKVYRPPEEAPVVGNFSETFAHDPRPPIPGGIPTEMPIVVFHVGNPPFLTLCLRQARKTNPNAAIYLIGDDSNKGIDPALAEHIPILKYCKSAAEFKSIYRHQSLNNDIYESFCMMRWFVLYEFMIDRRVPRCFIMDSDVLLYADMAKEFRRFYQYKFTVNHHWGGGNSYVGSPAMVNELCQLIHSAYDGTDPYLTAWVENLYSLVLKYEKAGGISDMVYVHKYYERNPYTVGETSCVIDGSTFDHNINSAGPVWEEEGKIKKIRWKGDVPYCRQMDNGMDVRFCLLHFQGKAKDLMESYLRV